MWWLHVTGAWAQDSGGVDGGTRNIPQIALDYPGLLRCKDLSNTPAGNLLPDPNVGVCYVECDEAAADLINADGNYIVTDQGAL